MLEATIWSNPISDPRLELFEREEDRPRKSRPLPRGDETNHVTSQASEMSTAPTMHNTPCSSETLPPCAEYAARPFRQCALSHWDNMAARSAHSLQTLCCRSPSPP